MRRLDSAPKAASSFWAEMVAAGVLRAGYLGSVRVAWVGAETLTELRAVLEDKRCVPVGVHYTVFARDKGALAAARAVLEAADTSSLRHTRYEVVDDKELICGGLIGHYDVVCVPARFNRYSDAVVQTASEKLLASLRIGGRVLIGFDSQSEAGGEPRIPRSIDGCACLFAGQQSRMNIACIAGPAGATCVVVERFPWAALAKGRRIGEST